MCGGLVWEVVSRIGGELLVCGEGDPPKVPVVMVIAPKGGCLTGMTFSMGLPSCRKEGPDECARTGIRAPLSILNFCYSVFTKDARPMGTTRLSAWCSVCATIPINPLEDAGVFAPPLASPSRVSPPAPNPALPSGKTGVLATLGSVGGLDI